MTEHSFSLIPFSDSKIPEIRLTGRISRNLNILNVYYSLMGRTAEILFPEPSRLPARRVELWRTTCFEFFLAFPEQPQYWEVNLSPSGDWNVYHMDAYRRLGFREDLSIQQLPFTIQKEPECFSVSVNLDLRPIISAEQQIQASITSVIQTKDGHETYWALTHPGLQADFHLRESFTLVLEE